MMKKILLGLLGVALLAAMAENSFGMGYFTQPAPVTDFNLQRYLGKWYEIARFENRFENGLSHVTAEYVMRPDGKVTVINRGYNAAAGQWRETQAQATLAQTSTVGELKITFFWPLRALYKIIALDEKGYKYALVTGKNRSTLWILSRTPQLDQAALEILLAKAREEGFDTDKLHYIDQGKVNPPPPAPWASPAPAPATPAPAPAK